MCTKKGTETLISENWSTENGNNGRTHIYMDLLLEVFGGCHANLRSDSYILHIDIPNFLS